MITDREFFFFFLGAGTAFVIAAVSKAVGGFLSPLMLAAGGAVMIALVVIGLIDLRRADDEQGGIR